MRKYFSGAVAAGLVVTGSLAWAGPGAAQAPPVTELEATLEVDGTFLSVASVDSCSTPEDTFSFVQWGIFEGTDPSWEDILAGNIPAQLVADLEGDSSVQLIRQPFTASYWCLNFNLRQVL